MKWRAAKTIRLNRHNWYQIVVMITQEANMDTSTDLSLTTRLEKLERQNRVFKIAALLALLAIGSLLFIAARPVSVQTAEKFVVVDSTGRTIAVLGPDA